MASYTAPYKSVKNAPEMGTPLTSQVEALDIPPNENINNIREEADT